MPENAGCSLLKFKRIYETRVQRPRLCQPDGFAALTIALVDAM